MKRTGALFPTLASLTLGGAVHAAGTTTVASAPKTLGNGESAGCVLAHHGDEPFEVTLDVYDYQGRPVGTRRDRLGTRLETSAGQSFSWASRKATVRFHASSAATAS